MRTRFVTPTFVLASLRHTKTGKHHLKARIHDKNTQNTMKMEDDNMILASMNPTVADNERPTGLFAKLFSASKRYEAKVMHDKQLKQDVSPASSTHSQKKHRKSESAPLKRKRASSPVEQIGKGLIDMAEAQAALCRWDKAFELWNQALELQTSKLDPHHLVVAATLARRGRAYSSLGQWYPAALDLGKAAHIYQSTNDNVLASDTLIQLAEVQERMGHLDEAVASMETALALKEAINDEESVARLNCLIGNVQHQQRDYERALESYRAGLECYEQAGVDKSHPHVVWAKRRATDRSMQGHLFWRQAGKKTTG